ncbi:AlbA family DNA-binding domain-containing protein [Pseudomonas capsici]|uniref:AlbA family DNA-binding domain-containing protein n=1 Tax=Pseudomonas capsici TaxID=2810614 RepID=UPI0021F14429|nr:ATP-binding protein [Pseudomonas capsici]MCV4283195.1 ATP-binding protein [Pseudomonas capsici]
MSISKQVHAGFGDFFAKPSLETLRSLIKNNIGETDHVEFKEAWPEKGKLAKHVLALANSGGGVLVIGIKEGGSLTAVGIDPKVMKDKTVVGNMIKLLVPESLIYEVFDFNYQDSENSDLKGKAFQVLLVESEPSRLPYLAIKASGDLKANAVYVRSNSSSNEATHEQLQNILSSRIGTEEAARRLLDLGEHCEQLKMLFSQLPYRRSMDWLLSPNIRAGNSIFSSYKFGDKLASILAEAEKQPTYEDFIIDCIKKKKVRIQKELDI